MERLAQYNIRNPFSVDKMQPNSSGDPLLCPRCHHEMRIIALIDEADVIERILRHLGLWEVGVRVDAARDPPEPAEPDIEPWLDDPFPDYDNEPVFAQK